MSPLKPKPHMDTLPDEQGRRLSIETVFSMPLVKLVFFASTLLMAGWVSRQYVNEMTGSVDKVATSVDQVQKEVERMRKELKEELERRTYDRWTRTDQRFWSYELDKINGGKVQVPQVQPVPVPP